MLTGYPFYTPVHEKRIYEMETDREGISDETFLLILQCCKLEPKDRPTMAEIKTRCQSLGIIPDIQEVSNEEAVVGINGREASTSSC